METAEVRQRRGIRGQPAQLLLEPRALAQTHLGDPVFQLAGDLDQHLDQERHRAAGGADVGHEQHGVARGLVDLHPVSIHQLDPLELVPVVAGATDRQSDSGGVQDEFVALPHLRHVAQAGSQRLTDVAVPELLGDHVRGTQAGHVLAQQRMVVDRVAQLHRVLDLTGHQFESLQRDLPAAQVERRQDLVVGRGRGVGHVSLVERLGHLLLEILVEDVDHRALAQRSQRLVRRLGCVHPHPGLGGIRGQPPVQKFLVAGRACRVARQLLLEGFGVVGVLEAFAYPPGRLHGGAAAGDRVEPGEREPGFVPEEDQIRLDRQAFLHHALHVVDDPVEGAVGQGDHLDAIELPGALEFEQLRLDAPHRHRPVHRVVVERIGLQVDDVGAAEHHPVVMGLVAVAVQQHDVTRSDQGLGDDLVRRRGPVGDEVRLPRPERLGGEFLGLAQRAGRLQQ